MRAFFKHSAYLFSVLAIVFVPTDLYPRQEELSNFLFKPLLEYLSQAVLGWPLQDPGISSDSSLMYALLLFLLLLSFILSFLTRVIKPYPGLTAGALKISAGLMLFYLALQMAQYGFDKVFKAQFYLPEPNILYTPFGKLDQDILFWSTLGTSYSYNVLTGGLEVLAAVLLLFNRTRAPGLFLSAFMILYIIGINFCFDISVKLFSVFLFFLNLILLSPYLKKLFDLFVLRNAVWPLQQPRSNRLLTHPVVTTGFGFLGALYIFSASLFPFIESGHFNDDKLPRPYLHGAYELQTTGTDSCSVNPALNGIKRVFIHRFGYIIFQDDKDNMEDFKLSIDTTGHRFILTDYDARQTLIHYSFNKKDSLLYLSMSGQEKLQGKSFKMLDWKKLPALQAQFHWRMDGD